MKDLRFIIVDEKRGALIGTYNPDGQSGEDALMKAFAEGGKVTQKIGIMFAGDDLPFHIDRVAAFKDEEAAKGFARWILTFFKDHAGTWDLVLRVLPVETEFERFATATELLQAGHAKYIHSLADGLYDDETVTTVH